MLSKHLILCGFFICCLAKYLQAVYGMRTKKWLSLFILLIGWATQSLAVSPAERKAAWNSPAPQKASPEPTESFSYSAMGESFTKDLQKKTEAFIKSIPPAESDAEPLKKWDDAARAVQAEASSSNQSSLLAQYSAAIISTIQQTTRLELNLIARSKAILAKQKAEKIQEIESRKKSESLKGLSPMAIALGAADHSSSLTSPLSMRNQTHQMKSITSRAYKNPN